MSDRPTINSTFTEREVAAYVLLVLTRRKIIDRATARQAARIFRIQPEDARRAAARDTEDPRLSSIVTQPATSAAGPPPTKVGAPRKTRGYMNRREGPDGPERRCTKCGKWKPATEDHFGWKDKAKTRFRSWCRPCWNDHQRERYLTRAEQEALEDAGLVFVLKEDKTFLSCAKCGKPLKAGDEVTGRTTLTHTACGDTHE